MRAVVLGAAAGGGFPQWNSASVACRRARSGDPKAKRRTQASLAVSPDEQNWFLFNGSPDLREQIQENSFLHPSGATRHSPIAGVVLTGGDVDAVAGLLVMREGHAFTIHAAAPTLSVLEANPIFGVLARDVVRREVAALEAPFPLRGAEGAPSGLVATLFAVPGKVPLFLEADETPPAVATDGRTVGIAVSDGTATLFFVPGCAAVTSDLADRLRGADLVFFDATLWSDDEMIRAGVGRKTGRRMGHMSLSGPDGVLAAFAPLGVRQKVLIHMNNSNPVLLDDSPEHAEAVRQGWVVAEDGMSFQL